MSDTGHTPLPWRVEQDTTLIWGNCNPDDHTSYGMGYPIAECRVNPSGNWSKGPYADEAEENAAYIVTACNALPILVEALERVTRSLSDQKGGWKGRAFLDAKEVLSAFESARAALASIKGGDVPARVTIEEISE